MTATTYLTGCGLTAVEARSVLDGSFGRYWLDRDRRLYPKGTP